MKKTLTLIAICALAAFAAVGCNKADDKTPEPETKATETPVTGTEDKGVVTGTEDKAKDVAGEANKQVEEGKAATGK